ncbi:CCA tRNA nucleotidyltransferase [Candidatus Woesearchaeota archaeon]|nr:CCA tRNA nucleotidyltransferase [Candidatus Woesearchaeota archaeon]
MFKRIINKIKPNEKEEQEVKSKVNSFLKILNNKLLHAEAIVGGSFAKGTWLKNQHDIDIFVLFEKNQNMSTRLEVVLKSIFKNIEKLHGSRDYFIIEYENLSFEIVPVLKIEKPEQAENITDISHMHVAWVKNKTNENLADEIRLTKYFMKINNCYGAETYIGGFSGYLAELITIYYESFLNLVKNAENWKYGEVIDIEKNNKFSTDQKFPLIVIDPVQPNRNAAAALRKDKFELFIETCKKFSKKQNESFFNEKKIDQNKYNLIFKIEPLKGSKDVVGTKMLKVFEKIERELKENGFVIKKSAWEWRDYGYFYFNIEKKTLDKNIKHFGPPTKFKEDAEKFKEKYKGFKVKEEKERLYVILPRKFTKLNNLIINIMNDKEISEKIRSMVQLK